MTRWFAVALCAVTTLGCDDQGGGDSPDPPDMSMIADSGSGDAALIADTASLPDAASRFDFGRPIDSGAPDGAAVDDGGAPSDTSSPDSSGFVADATSLGPDVLLPDSRPPDAAPTPADTMPPDAVLEDAGPTACLAGVIRVGQLEVFAYEASRPDALAGDGGEDQTRACSRSGVVPWVDAAIDEARAACEASGFRLCTSDEWASACTGGQDRGFAYGARHSAGLCNDHIAGSGALEVTGGRPACVSPEGVFDLSGNAWE